MSNPKKLLNALYGAKAGGAVHMQDGGKLQMAAGGAVNMQNNRKVRISDNPDAMLFELLRKKHA